MSRLENGRVMIVEVGSGAEGMRSSEMVRKGSSSEESRNRGELINGRRGASEMFTSISYLYIFVSVLVEIQDRKVTAETDHASS